MSDSAPEYVELDPPNDWRVIYNTLYDIEPAAIEYTEPADYLLLTEDLLQLAHDEAGLLLDVGWYPDGDPDGAYRLVVVVQRGERPNWQDPIRTYRTDKLASLRQKITDVTSSLP